MKRSLLLTAMAMLMISLLLIAGCGSDKKEGGVAGETAGGADLVQKGDPVLAAAEGYVGSEVCGGCHGTIFVGWSKSLHNKPLKTVSELGSSIFVNDTDENGVNDFVDGFDFNDPDFETTHGYSNPFSAMTPTWAPVLSASAGNYYITIGDTQYEVQRTQGGNGYWKQRYHTKIGNSYYILPVQYNEVSKRYSAYNADHWYKWKDSTSGANKNGKIDPGEISGVLYTDAYGSNELVVALGKQNTSSSKKGTARSWENRCAGCHQTGLTAESQVNTYGTGTAAEVVSGYVELNIGCESCHGPGADHVKNGGNPLYITNPANLAELGYPGIRMANMVCGACHSRGEGKATLSGMALNLEYPSKVEFGQLRLPLPGGNFLGNSPADIYVTLSTTASTAYFPSFASPTTTEFDFHTAYRGWYSTEGIDFPTYIASSNHHQQWTDIEQGPHAPDKDYDTTCWGCHDPHQAKGDHQIKDSITEEGVAVATNNDDNTLCLACHATHGPFSDITPADVASGASAVGAAVMKHMGDEAVMNVDSYDPAGSAGLGRCSKCHMPKTASSSGIKTKITTTTSIEEGDIHNHTFNIIWPTVNSLATNTSMIKMVNSCYSVGCHNDSSALGSPVYLDVLEEWSKSGHADFTGEPFRHWDEDGVVSTSCAKCHTKAGFNDYAEDGSISSSATFALGNVISCGACHASGESGKTKYDDTTTYAALEPVTFPSGSTATLGDASNICMICHQGRESRNSINSKIASDETATTYTFTNIHYYAAAATFFGSVVHGGYEYSGMTYSGQNAFEDHEADKKKCIGCHLRGTEKDHDFKPQVADCTTAGCHTGASFDVLSGEPGDNKTDIETLEGELLTAIQSYATATTPINKDVVYSADNYPYFFEDKDGSGDYSDGDTSFSSFDGKLLKAAYNYQVSKKEPCGYIHNGTYIMQILYDSIVDLGGTPPVTPPNR